VRITVCLGIFSDVLRLFAVNILLQEFRSRAKSAVLFIRRCSCNVWLSHTEAQCTCQFLCHAAGKSSGTAQLCSCCVINEL